RKVRESAYHVIESKGATNWAVSLSLLKVAGAILRYENSILSVSTRCSGFYGLPDICLSLPVILDREGVKQVIAGPISPHEQEQLSASGRILRQVYEDLHLSFPWGPNSAIRSTGPRPGSALSTTASAATTCVITVTGGDGSRTQTP
ncbi:MAG TPA: hypothetical protein PK636_04075, partial [bacterium]|nr:hypothetical protein [bacterium]